MGLISGARVSGSGFKFSFFFVSGEGVNVSGSQCLPWKHPTRHGGSGANQKKNPKTTPKSEILPCSAVASVQGELVGNDARVVCAQVPVILARAQNALI